MNYDNKDVFVVGIMPCTAKKDEAARKQLSTDDISDVNVSITSFEMV